MLYVFHGNDLIAVRDRAHAFLQKYAEKGITLEQIAPEEYELGMLVDRAGARSLFAGEQVTVLDTPSEKTEVLDDVLECAELLGESQNTFVVIEGALRAPEKNVFTKYAKEIHEEKVAKEKDFNIFSMTDAFLRRDKKSLWVLLQRAKQHGVSDEEVAGVLYWQLKMLMLAERAASASESGQKPFVYTKAKKALEKFENSEPNCLARDLLSIYHDAHLGKQDMSVALERFVLSL